MRKLREFYIGVVPPTGNYANLENLPAINGVVLTPNTTLADLGLTGIYKFKGSVATKSDLPTSGVSVGDVYDVKDIGSNFAWTGTDWDDLGPLIDLTPYLLKSDAETTYATKGEIPNLAPYLLKSDADATYATKSEIPNLTPYLLKSEASTTYATKSEIPTLTSQLDNDSGFLTEHQDISNLATKEELSQALSNIDLTKQGSGVPTTSTEGSVGQIYVDITNNEAYICVNADSNNFTWKKITYTPTSTTVVLSSNNWDTTNRTYTIPVVGLTADTILWVAPTVSADNANETHFATYGIKAIQQNNNSLVINCTVIPNMDISIDIIM